MRAKVLMGLITAAMLIAGVAWAGSGEAESSASVTIVPVDDAGTVTLGEVEAGLSILAVEPEAGWNVSVEVPVGREVEARFESDGARVQFEAELQDGEVRLTIERASVDSTSTSVDASSTTSTSDAPPSTTQGTTSSTSPASTSTTEAPTTSTTAATTSTSQASTSTTQATTSTTIDDDDEILSIPDALEVFEVGSAGSVTIEISDGRLDLVSVDANGGWSYEIDKAEGDEVRVEFEADSDAEAELRVRINDGRLEVESRSD